jgi:poly-gamma-glutamate capsule biosynthesis protein CapA/YwtB (metallophosphatase superfamily)
MSITIALAGDTMVGPGVGAALERKNARSFFSPALVEAVAEADLCILNLECCISDRGEPWSAPGKPFFFRAPPRSVEILSQLGVDCVNLANNHSLDFGREALLDTFTQLESAGIRWVGAGPNLTRARAPVILRTGEFRLGVIGVADHPAEFSATADQPGTAVADFRGGVPEWLTQTLSAASRAADAVLLTPHWGPNFTARPMPHIHSAAQELSRQATLIAGHSAHVFHGVKGNVLFDLGDFLQTYAGERAQGSLVGRALRRAGRELRSAVGDRSGRRSTGATAPGDSFLRRKARQARRLLQELRAARLRDDLGLLFLVTLDRAGPSRIEALPLKLAHCYTGLAEGADAAWIGRRFQRACRALGTGVSLEHGRLVISGNRTLSADVEA